MEHRPEERDPTRRGPRSRPRRRSGAPDVPHGDRKVVPISATTLHVEAFPWTGGLLVWVQDESGRWVRREIRRR